MVDTGLAKYNFIQDYMIPIIAIILTVTASLYAIYLSRRLKKKAEEAESW